MESFYLIIIVIVAIIAYYVISNLVKILFGGLALLFIYFMFFGNIISFPAHIEDQVNDVPSEKVNHSTEETSTSDEGVIIKKDERGTIIYIPNKNEASSKTNVPKRDTYKVNTPVTRERVNGAMVYPNYCTKLKFRGSKYVVLEGYYDTEEELLERYRLLRSRNISGLKIIWLPCYNSHREQFAIVFGRPCKSLTSIDNIKESFQERLNNENQLERLPTVIQLKKTVNKSQI